MHHYRLTHLLVEADAAPDLVGLGLERRAPPLRFPGDLEGLDGLGLIGAEGEDLALAPGDQALLGDAHLARLSNSNMERWLRHSEHYRFCGGEASFRFPGRPFRCGDRR
jgi:hypothetical protein